MLLDAKPPKPVGKFRRYVPLPVRILLVLVLAGFVGFLTYHFWNIRQERAVTRFLLTLEQGNYQEAYKLWQPPATYTYASFLSDWGMNGDYGKIHDFEILDSQAKGLSVVVYVSINGQPPLELIVKKESGGLAFAPPDF
ncbi:MAG: hypothetical protein ACM3NO_02285 [Deltaproteobacteria bacterium]